MRPYNAEGPHTATTLFKYFDGKVTTIHDLTSDVNFHSGQATGLEVDRSE